MNSTFLKVLAVMYELSDKCNELLDVHHPRLKLATLRLTAPPSCMPPLHLFTGSSPVRSPCLADLLGRLPPPPHRGCLSTKHTDLRLKRVHQPAARWRLLALAGFNDHAAVHGRYLLTYLLTYLRTYVRTYLLTLGSLTPSTPHPSPPTHHPHPTPPSSSNPSPRTHTRTRPPLSPLVLTTYTLYHRSRATYSTTCIGTP